MKAKAAVAWEAKKSLSIEMVDGYDHSYHFISTFIGEHIAYHAKALKS